jgi:epoxyqueuosine reductase
LADAPPSGDLTYVLPSAESAIALAVSLDQEAAERYIAEEDMWALNDSHRRSYRMIESASLAIQEYLGARGHEVATPYPNFAYRDEPRTRDMVPPLSHKYVCTAAGVGWIGWSENLLTREYGALVTLGSVVTSAVLKPSPMVEEDWCSNCKICVATCPTHYMPKQEDGLDPLS